MTFFTKTPGARTPRPSNPSLLRRFLGACVLISAVSGRAAAQVDNRSESWITDSIQTAPPASTGLHASVDTQWRWTQDNHQLALRPALGYQVVPGLLFHLGYQFTETLMNEGANRHEHRPWEQITFRHPVTETLNLSLRWRQEQRYGWGDGTGHRSRLQLRAVFAPGALAPVRLVLWHEYFHNLNTVPWLPKAGFDQDRTFVGASVETPWKTRFELGYLGIYANRRPDQLSHCISLIATTEI